MEFYNGNEWRQFNIFQIFKTVLQVVVVVYLVVVELLLMVMVQIDFDNISTLGNSQILVIILTAGIRQNSVGGDHQE